MWQVGFYHVHLPEFLVIGRENVYFRWLLNCEAYDPSQIDDDAVEEYPSKFAQPGGLRGMCACFREPGGLKQNHESADKKQTLPVLAIGAESLSDRRREANAESC